MLQWRVKLEGNFEQANGFCNREIDVMSVCRRREWIVCFAGGIFCLNHVYRGVYICWLFIEVDTGWVPVLRSVHQYNTEMK